MSHFNETNTEGYTAKQLAELNELWTQLDVEGAESDYVQHVSERLLAAYDGGREALEAYLLQRDFTRFTVHNEDSGLVLGDWVAVDGPGALQLMLIDAGDADRVATPDLVATEIGSCA